MSVGMGETSSGVVRLYDCAGDATACKGRGRYFVLDYRVAIWKYAGPRASLGRHKRLGRPAVKWYINTISIIRTIRNITTISTR